MRLTGETAALALITVGGAAVRAYRLDAADLWLDEANTLLRGIQPLGLMLRELATADVHPPLFYLLLKAPLAFSTSELALRVLPWLFGVLQIPLAYLIARDLNGPAAGLVAALLTAVSAPLVVFSQEGRMYSLLALLVLAATWSLVRALERSDARWWAAFALASTAALYTHNMAGLFLVAHLLAAIGSAPTRRIVGVGAVCLALYLPWLPLALGQTLGTFSSGGWLGQPPQWWLPLLTLVNLIGGSSGRHGMLSPQVVLDHPLLLASAVALLAFGWRGMGKRPIARRVFLATVTVPIGLTLLLSQITRVYIDKTFLADALLFIVVMAVSVAPRPSLGERLAPVLAVAMVALFQTLAVAVHWSTPRDNYRALVHDLKAHAQPGDLVVVVPGFIDRPFSYYVARDASLRIAAEPSEPPGLHPTSTSPRTLPSDSPVGYRIRSEGSTLSLQPLDTAWPERGASNDVEPARLWVVNGGPWGELQAVRDASRWRRERGYVAVWKRLYPDEAVTLTLFQRP